jgi:phosphoserine phosphatase
LNLVVQGAGLEKAGAGEIARLAGGRHAEEVAPHAYRVRNVGRTEALGPWCDERKVDHAWMPEGRRFADLKLLAMDMDSTLITIECIDELGDLAGKKAEIAAITAQAMRGEIEYRESLRRRVRSLAGLPESSLNTIYDQRLKLTPGAEKLVDLCRKNAVELLLVSGGFTFFTDHVRDRLKIDFTRSNVLEVADGALTGRMVDQPWGDICDGEEKRKMLLETCAAVGVAPAKAIAVGDGANDLPMMAAAGLAVAYHAKPKVREAANVCIDDGGLDRLLEVVR